MPSAPPSALRTVFSGRRPLLPLTIGGFVVHQIAEALVPVLIGVVIDRAIEPGDGTALLIWLGVLCALFAALLFAWRLGELVAVRMYEEGARDIRRALVTRVLSPAGFVRRRTPGELLSIASSDADRASAVIWLFGSGAAQLAAVLTAAVSLLLISLPLGLLVLLSTPVLVVLLHFVTAPLERRTDAEQAATAAASATAADLLTGLRAIAGLRAEDAAVARFAEANRRSLLASRRAVALKATYTVASMAGSTILLAVVAGAAAAEAAAGRVSVGELVAVLGLAQFLHWPVSGLAFIGAELAGVRASAKRVDAVLGEEGSSSAAEPPNANCEDGPVELVFEDVRTAHAGPFSVRVDAGAHLAVTVADPRGAVELQEVLAGLRPLDAGRILVGGRDLAGAQGVVLAPPHQPAIFAGTLRENVELHRPLTIAALDAAAETAVLDDVLHAAGGDWAYPIGERGLTLSGGQRQRVALARGLARDSAVLVLHDPTSAVDSVTEATIAQRLRAHRAGRTTVILAASPALAQVCDDVLHVPAPQEQPAPAAESAAEVRA
ncbi:ABC transporter transmembrane domain-containing protein [Microbacterium sp.]|uniref:ABC transporter transmembrane domain-containing protein n=1 Tax=Microbacterium sp. TaxID=51671 RepID=UPI0039E53BB7